MWWKATPIRGLWMFLWLLDIFNSLLVQESNYRPVFLWCVFLFVSYFLHKHCWPIAFANQTHVADSLTPPNTHISLYAITVEYSERSAEVSAVSSAFSILWILYTLLQRYLVLLPSSAEHPLILVLLILPFLRWKPFTP